MHKLLERQLKRQFGSLEAVPANLQPFLEGVSLTYEQSDSDRRLVERSLDLASQELLQRNAELRAKQHEQQVIFDSVPAFIIYKDTQNRILRLNESAAKALGGTAAQLEGKPTAEILPKPVADALYEDDLKVIQSGQPRLGIIESHPTADGEVHWMRTDKVPFRDEKGNVIGVIVFSVDITERTKAEAQLKDSEERYRLIVDTATEGIWTIDEQARTKWVNPVMAGLLGYTPAEMVGRSVFNFMAQTEIPTAQQQFGALMGGSNISLDFKFQRRDGSDLWVQASAAAMKDDKGRVIGALGMMTDITQRKAAEAKLKEAYEKLQAVDKERTQFLNNAAHELATPLTPIKLQMRLLRLAGETPAAQAKAAEILERNFDRLAHLVKDLLDAARLQAESLKLHRRDIDLREVVAQSVETYLPAAQEAGINLRVDGDLPEAVANVDPGRIGQVLDNLLSNALKFTPRGGDIDVELLRDANGLATIRVCDNGTGMRAEDLLRLFRPFSQVHDTMQGTVGGTGLGLYVCRGIIDAHGGAIHAASAGLGKGSTFWFELPMAGHGPIAMPPGVPPLPTPPIAVPQRAASSAA